MSPQFLCVPFGQFPKKPSLYPPSPREEMTSGKSCLIAVVIGGILYVLAGPPYSEHVPDPCFEQYDPRTRRWSPLPAPPILKRCSKFFTGRLCSELAYAVIGTKLYLSSSKASVVYDCATATEESTWEPCNLFDGFNPHGLSTPWKDNGRIPAYWKGPGDKTVIGPPFPFEKGTVLYDNDTLICYAPCLEDAIVAFQIEDGRVVREQCLDYIPKHVCQKLVDLGGGCFSTMSHEVDWNTMQKTTLSVLCFKLSKLSKPVGDGQVCRFLDCEVFKTHNVELRGCYFPFFSFVR